MNLDILVGFGKYIYELDFCFSQTFFCGNGNILFFGILFMEFFIMG